MFELGRVGPKLTTLSVPKFLVALLYDGVIKRFRWGPLIDAPSLKSNIWNLRSYLKIIVRVKYSVMHRLFREECY